MDRKEIKDTPNVPEADTLFYRAEDNSRYCEAHNIKIEYTQPDARHNTRPKFPEFVIDICLDEKAE